MIRNEVFSNGVRVVTEEIPYVRSVAVGLWIGVGSRDENEKNNGITHFIEHMMFKGTQNRSAREIAETLDSIGGQLNAFTSKEYTCYYAKVIDEHIDTAIDVLADMFFNSLFKEEEIDKEKNVVVEEIKMYEDTPDELIHDLFAHTLWQGHSLGRPILGTIEAVNSLTRDDIIDYYNKHYVPNNLVIAVAGNIKHDDIVKKIENYFKSFQGNTLKRITEAPVSKGKIITKEKDLEQVHLCLGTPGLPLDHPDIYALHILNTILGGGLSSRLFQTIREERGLAYTVYSYHSSYQDAGLFSIYTGMSINNIQQVIDLILTELNDIKKNGLSEVEIKRAKEHIKGSLLLSLESVNSRMSRLGKSLLTLKRIVTPEESVDRINAVTKADIKNLANMLFNKNNFIITTIGQVPEEIKIEL